MKTSSKFTIVFSAYQAGYSDLDNYIKHLLMAKYLTDELHVDFQHAVGVYKGGAEQSFVVHTNSANVRGQVVRLALDEYNQECVLVSFNRDNIISLKSNKRCVGIGSTFKHHTSTPSNSDYTVLNGTDFYTVY